MAYKLLIFISLTVLGLTACKPPTKTTVPTADNSMNSVDWNGVYYGILPCADCEGIETVMQLKTDKSYSLQTKYLGRSPAINASTGTFTWNKEGNKITLDNDHPGVYLVGENKLVHLDKDGKTISGNQADKYVLLKNTGGVTEKYWKLIELYGKPVTQTKGMNKEPHMVLHKEGNKINMVGSCNNFQGVYELKSNNQVSFGKLAGTLMACPEMETENQFIKVLSEADNYYVDENRLVLNKAKMAPLARFEAVYFK